MGVAVALEDEARRRPGGHAIDLGREPDLTGTAANSVHLRSRRFRQWRQGAAELDYVAIAVSQSSRSWKSARMFSSVMGLAAHLRHTTSADQA